MIVKGLIINVNTDTELTALTGLSYNQFVWHEGNNSVYRYEPNLGAGDITSSEGGFWCKDNAKAHSLEEYKKFRYEEIDARSGELISMGYSYGGQTMSLSQNAQLNLLGLNASRDELTYPVDYNNIDDTGVYSIQNATDMHNMYLTALGTKKAHLDSGTALKDQVRAAVNEAAVQLIVDNR